MPECIILHDCNILSIVQKDALSPQQWLLVKNLSANKGDAGLIPGWEDALEEEMASHPSILAWEIPWTEEPGGATVHGVTRAGPDLVTKLPPY